MTRGANRIPPFLNAFGKNRIPLAINLIQKQERRISVRNKGKKSEQVQGGTIRIQGNSRFEQHADSFAKGDLLIRLLNHHLIVINRLTRMVHLPVTMQRV